MGAAREGGLSEAGPLPSTVLRSPPWGSHKPRANLAVVVEAPWTEHPFLPNAALLLFPSLAFPEAGWKEGTKPGPRAGLSPKGCEAKQHLHHGCGKQLVKIQQPLCLTTRSDLWYFLPKQFICLAEQLINSRAHPSRGLARAGRQRGQMAAALAGLIQF